MNLLKIVGVIFILIILASFLFERTSPLSHQATFGVSFSPRYARYLKLDWQKTFLQILDELKVRNIRIPTYWTTLEPEKQKYDFSDTDFMLSEASKRGVRVILVLGARQPRWPECHIPSWAKGLTVSERQQATLSFIETVVKRYQATSAIWAYQVENEPFVTWFGEGCDPPNSEFLQQEIELVKKLDTKRPAILTDSGEWGSWIDAMKFADIVGISVYRRAYNTTLGIYMNYPFAPWMYTLKAAFIGKLFAKPNQSTIIAELQTEAWLSDKDIKEGSPTRENQLFSLENFKENINFAQKTGFDETYLWGVEWWYFMAQHGYPQYLDYAKTLF